PGEFTQLTGRAGRRGMDELGYAVVLWSRDVAFAEVAALAANRSWALRSSFRPTYNMAVNLVSRYSPERARHLLNCSFAQYQVNDHVVALESEVERLRQVAAGSPSTPLAERAERSAARLERRIAARGDSLAHQLDQVLGLLGAWGYVEGWSLTPSGERLASIYHEADLLVAEALGEGLLDGLEPHDLASLVSVLTFEERGPASSVPSFREPEAQLRWTALDALSGRVATAEAAAGLPLTRAPDPGFAPAARAWLLGRPLESVMRESAAGGGARSSSGTSGSGPSGLRHASTGSWAGDFVRNVKCLIDLLRQIAEVAPCPQTAAAAREAAEVACRGVVAASCLI
ncbi:MAG: hypothetical protein ACRDZQ_12100, partial [Acidimicrobiales bacterium]